MKKKKKYLLLLISILLCWTMGIGWLGILIFAMVFIYVIITKAIVYLRPAFLRKACKNVFVFFYLFSITIALRVFVFDIYKIPSSSMENTLYPGDVILVNKLKYGPQLPRSPFEIPWVNLVFYLNDAARKKMGTNWWDYKRLSGTNTIQQGDVFVFNMNFGVKMNIVKRCVALPGDVFEIRDGQIYTNDTLYNSPNLAKNKYEIAVKNKRSFYQIMDSLELDISWNSNYNTPLQLRGNITNSEFEKLKTTQIGKSIKREIAMYDKKATVFPNSPTDKWTLDDFGPFQIPKKGLKILLNLETYPLYHSTISFYEKQEIKENNGLYYINGRLVEDYVFQRNYFFMMGDFRKGSSDSRVWGLVPEEQIIGKTNFVLYSYNNGMFNWKRFMKRME